jgi:hypothetical protein
VRFCESSACGALNIDRIPPPLMLMDERCRAAPIRTPF